jgi:TonB family protein
LLRREGKFEEAQREFEEALRRKPNYTEARTILGLTHFQLGEQFKLQGNLERAVAEIQEALRLEPDEAYWHDALAIVLYKQGNTQEAAKERTEAARLSPEDSGLAGAGNPANGWESETKEAEAQPGGLGVGTPPFRVGGNVSAPICTYHPAPRLSEKARAMRYQGTTVLWVVVNAEGNVAQAYVVKPLGFGLDQKALHAVRTWKFKPGICDGKPVAVRIKVEVTFRIY